MSIGSRGGTCLTTINDCVFHANSANWGGALAIKNGNADVRVTDSTFSSNIAEVGHGGAIMSRNGASASTTGGTFFGCTRCLVKDNVAKDSGGGYYAVFTRGFIADSTFINNDAKRNNGGVSGDVSKENMAHNFTMFMH